MRLIDEISKICWRRHGFAHIRLRASRDAPFDYIYTLNMGMEIMRTQTHSSCTRKLESRHDCGVRRQSCRKQIWEFVCVCVCYSDMNRDFWGYIKPIDEGCIVFLS